MVDVEKVAQVRAIAKSLHRLPPPGRAQVANEQYDLGVRIHPELATKELVPDAPVEVRKLLGNWTPQRMENITETLKQVVADTNPALAARIENAKTEAQKAQLRSEVYGENRAVIDKATQQLADASPEDLE